MDELERNAKEASVDPRAFGASIRHRTPRAYERTEVLLVRIAK